MLKADGTVTTQTTAVIQTTTTNSGIAIVPNGTGAITADIPDGTVTGGNARGQYSVDLQRIRTSSTQVASSNYCFIGGGADNTVNPSYGSNGYSVVCGGYGNVNYGNFAFIGGGYGNGCGGNDNFQTICGGYSNQINSSGHSFIGGGWDNTITGGGTGLATISGGKDNTISNSIYGTISGGQSNTASTGTSATVIGGSTNTSSGTGSISGGLSSNATGYASVALGNTSNATGYASVALGGGTAAATRSVALGNGSNCTGGDYSIAFVGGQVVNGEVGSAAFGASKTTSRGGFSFGQDSLSYLQNQFSQSAVNIYGGNTNYYGFSQASQIVPCRQATISTGSFMKLSLDGTGVTSLIIPEGNNRAWNVTVDFIGVCTNAGAGGVTVGDCFIEKVDFLFKKVAGVLSISPVNVISRYFDASMGGGQVVYTPSGLGDLQIEFGAPTFANASTFRCVAKVQLVEVGWF